MGDSRRRGTGPVAFGLGVASGALLVALAGLWLADPVVSTVITRQAARSRASSARSEKAREAAAREVSRPPTYRATARLPRMPREGERSPGVPRDAIAYLGSADDLWLVSGDGSTRTRLTTRHVEQLVEWHPHGPGFVWCPDGTRLAFRSALDIWVVLADGSEETNVTDDGGEWWNWSPAWSPSGGRLAWTARLRRPPYTSADWVLSESETVATADADAWLAYRRQGKGSDAGPEMESLPKGAEKLRGLRSTDGTAEAIEWLSEPDSGSLEHAVGVWSPGRPLVTYPPRKTGYHALVGWLRDPRRLVVRSTDWFAPEACHHGVRVWDPESGDVSSIRQLTADDRYLTLSPDGSHLAFDRWCSETGWREVYVLDLRDRRVSRLTTGGGVQPAWRPTP